MNNDLHNERPYRAAPYAGGRPVAGLSALKRISWGAVFAGLVVALVIQLTLSLLGLGIGIGSINPTEEQNPASGLGTGALIWWIVSMLVSLFTGGWVAGRLAGMPTGFDSMLHGILTWSLFTLLSFYLLTTAVGRIISGVGSVVGSTLSLAGQGIAAVAPQASEAIQNELEQRNINFETANRRRARFCSRLVSLNCNLKTLSRRPGELATRRKGQQERPRQILKRLVLLLMR